MAVVETVQGPVDAGELGTVLVHEHVRFRDEAVAAEWPDRYDEAAELQAALEAVEAAKSRGVQTIVDPTAMFGGRDVRFMKRVADQSGVRIIAHSMPALPTGPRQLEIFLEEGVDPARVQIAHCGDTDDVDYIERLIDA